MKTRTIAGHKITLRSGLRYRASRPFAERGRRFFPVRIECMDTTHVETDPHLIDVTISDLTYDEANALVNKFNNGPTSWDGRIW